MFGLWRNKEEEINILWRRLRQKHGNKKFERDVEIGQKR